MPGKVAIVTGGTMGLGYAVTVALAAKGWHVHACARRGAAPPAPDPGSSGTITFHAHDVASPMDNLSFVDGVFADEGRIDALVNNAAALCRKHWSCVTYQDVVRSLRTNFVGPVEMTSACMPYLEASGGRVVNVTSSAVNKPRLIAKGLYAATKAALNVYTRSLADELTDGGRSVTVCAVCPGSMLTRMNDKGRDPAAVAPAVVALVEAGPEVHGKWFNAFDTADLSRTEYRLEERPWN